MTYRSESRNAEAGFAAAGIPSRRPFPGRRMQAARSRCQQPLVLEVVLDPLTGQEWLIMPLFRARQDLHWPAAEILAFPRR